MTAHLCSHCGGTGFIGDEPCEFCAATGRSSNGEKTPSRLERQVWVALALLALAELLAIGYGCRWLILAYVSDCGPWGGA